MENSELGVAHGSPRPRVASWSSVAYLTGMRGDLSAPRFQRLLGETRPAFEKFLSRAPDLDWTDLDAVMDVWRTCVTRGGRLLAAEGRAGRVARAFDELKWLYRMALLDHHLNDDLCPCAWTLRAAVLGYCQAQGWQPPVWPLPKWPLNAPVEASGATLLRQAVDRSRVWLAKQLLAWGALPDAADHRGVTPLHVAAFYGNAEMVSLLLGNGASVDPRRAANTPLDLALLTYQGAAAQALLRAGGTSGFVSIREDWLRQQVTGDAVLTAVLDRAVLSAAMRAVSEASDRDRL